MVGKRARSSPRPRFLNGKVDELKAVFANCKREIQNKITQVRKKLELLSRRSGKRYELARTSRSCRAISSRFRLRYNFERISGSSVLYRRIQVLFQVPLSHGRICSGPK